MYYSKPIYKTVHRLVEHANDTNNLKMFQALFVIEDKIIGLHPKKDKLQKAYDYINKHFSEGNAKQEILNYLIGEIHGKTVDR